MNKVKDILFTAWELIAYVVIGWMVLYGIVTLLTEGSGTGIY
jgi:hypothetical protein